MAEIGRQCCVMYGRCKMLGGLLLNIACSQHELGNDLKAKELLIESFYIYRVMEDFRSCKVVKNYAKEKLNFIIP